MKSKKLAVLTSGGDAPGMNAAIRAVVRTAIEKHWTPIGIKHGYTGLLQNDFFALGTRDVSHIIEKGGTFLGSSRSSEFKTKKGLEKALQHLRQNKIEGLIVIGGEGSQQGSFALAEKGFPVVGVASTIDNDLYGSDITIGVDAALNVALEAIDRLKITASSLGRVFLVEVMGRNCGYLALMAGIAGGAEVIVIPELEKKPEVIEAEIFSAYQRGKSHAIIVVAEGARYDAEKLAAYFKTHEARLGFELRVIKLGHVQRGGAPGAFDRLLATQLGAAAVEAITKGKKGVLMGWQSGKITSTPLSKVVSQSKKIDLKLLKLAKTLSV